MRHSTIASKLTDDQQLVLNLRFLISDEYTAIKHYTEILAVTKNEAVRKTIANIMDEERIHVGELQKLLFSVSPGEEEQYKKGAAE